MSFVDDFFEKKRKESQSATQPTGSFDFSMTTSPANTLSPQGMSGMGSTTGIGPSIPTEISQKFRDSTAYMDKVPEPDLKGKSMSQMSRDSEASTGEGTTTESSVPFDLSPIVKFELEREAKAKELVGKAKKGGMEFVGKLPEEDMALLNMGLKMEKERKDIIRAFDPTIDYPSSDVPYWQDPERLRDVTSRRLEMLGTTDQSNYAEEQFRAGGREGFSLGYYNELQPGVQQSGFAGAYEDSPVSSFFGSLPEDPGKPRGIAEKISRFSGTIVGNIVNPLTWGIFGMTKAASVPLMGETLAGNIASDVASTAIIGGLWNTGETIGSQKDAVARLQAIGEGAVAGLLFSGVLRGAGAGISLAKGKEVRLTRETGILKGDDWELQNIRYVPETHSYLVTPEDVAAGRMRWFAEIDASHPDSGRIWDRDGFRKIDFQKVSDGMPGSRNVEGVVLRPGEAISVRTTEWVPEAIKTKLRTATIADLPGIFEEAGNTPKSNGMTTPETFTIKNQTIPEINTSEKTTLFRTGELNNVTGAGIFLTKKKEVAEQYREYHNNAPVKEYEIGNLNLKEGKTRGSLLREIDPTWTNKTSDNVHDRIIRGGMKGTLTQEGMFQIYIEKRIKKILSKQGYDGVAYIGSGNDQDGEYQIFNSKNLTEITQSKPNTKNQTVPESKDRQENLTTKILEELGNRESVSKQFVSDLTKRADIKQKERDIVLKLLENEGDKISVREFKEKVMDELLPIKALDREAARVKYEELSKENSRLIKEMNEMPIEQYSLGMDDKRNKEITSKQKEIRDEIFRLKKIKDTSYEYVSLREDVRGDVSRYFENVYESPIENKTGDRHFLGQTDKYFGHVRLEDMADGMTRRIIEVQSDLYQKGGLDWEVKSNDDIKTIIGRMSNKSEKEKNDVLSLADKRDAELEKLKSYNNPTAHFRMVREEIAKAKQNEDLEKIQFPTGETAMKIEQLTNADSWMMVNEDRSTGEDLYEEDLKVGQEITMNDADDLVEEDIYVIAELLEDGEFKAVPISNTFRDSTVKGGVVKYGDEGFIEEALKRGTTETFSIYENFDTDHPIYKFYEKELAKYLKTNYDAKIVTDAQGVSWYEVDLNKVKGDRVTAFQDEAKDYHQRVANKYGINLTSLRKDIDGREYLKVLKSLDALDDKYTVIIEDRVYDRETGKEVIGHINFEDKTIRFSRKEYRANTGYHEVVHAFLMQMRRKNPKIVKEILDSIIKEYKITQEMADKEMPNPETGRGNVYELAEEHLADNLEYFVKNQEFETSTLSGRVKKFIKDLLERIKGLFGKEDKVYKLFNDIIEGRSPTKGYQTRIGKEFEKAEKKYQTPPKEIAAYEMRQANLTTKILDEIGTRETVSKQFVTDLTKRSDIKQSERDIIISALATQGDKINVPEFSKIVQDALLPLHAMTKTEIEQRIDDLNNKMVELDKKGIELLASYEAEVNKKEKDRVLGSEDIYEKKLNENSSQIDDARDEIRNLESGRKNNEYDYVSLKEPIRGNVIEYYENVYQGPVKNNAGVVHFGKMHNKYVLHTRVEEMGGGIRRIIEVQSDLIQKGKLDTEKLRKMSSIMQEKIMQDKIPSYEVGSIVPVRLPTRFTTGEIISVSRDKTYYEMKIELSPGMYSTEGVSYDLIQTPEMLAITQEVKNSVDKEFARLEQYNNPTIHFRGAREELAKAKSQGISKLRFPTGDTAMQVEGLTVKQGWQGMDSRPVDLLTLEPGEFVEKMNNGEEWVFLGVKDGIAKGIQREDYFYLRSEERKNGTGKTKDQLLKEIFDSGEYENMHQAEDVNHPIYKFYEKDLAKYLKTNYKAELITDEKGVTWYEVDMNNVKNDRVTAFQTIPEADDSNSVFGKLTPREYYLRNPIPETEFERLGKAETGPEMGYTKEEFLNLHGLSKSDFEYEGPTTSEEGVYFLKVIPEIDIKPGKTPEDVNFDDLFGPASKIPEEKKPESYLFVSSPKNDAELIEKLYDMRGGETPKQFLKNNSVAIANTADNLARIFQGNPSVHEVQKFLKDKSPQIMQAAYKYGVRRNMFDVRKVDEVVAKIEMGVSAKSVNAKGSGLTSQQKATVISMEGYGSLLKGTEDYKINMTQLSESLKEMGARLHFLETPSAERKKIPFTLMGNKASTIQRIISPLVEQAVKLGKNIYVEPFSGAGTSLYILPKLFASGLKEANLNFFDREKYIVVKAIQDGTINVRESVDKAWNTVIDAIAEDLIKIPAVKEVMDNYGVRPGTPEFYNVAELAFYPQYAKKFFEETPDAKLAKNGEITETFKEWLTQKVMKDQGIEEEPARVIASEILSDTTLFEKNYPQISKDISDRLESFDNIDNVKTVDDALVTTFARHMKQRGTSGQRIVSASNGFQDMFGAYRKTLDGLTNYEKILRKHGDKINIHSMDGKEFIAKMGAEKDVSKVVAYFDPPYVRTTAVYVKNAPEAVKMSLGEYADYGKISGIFDPLKFATAIYTNDIDGKYMQALDSMYGDRMNKEILGYREGTTPTSVVTTSDLRVKPAELRLDYYQLVRSNRLRTKMEALSEDLLPMVQDQLKKELSKVIKEVFSENKDIVDRLTKIREGQEKAIMKFEDLKNAIEKATTGRDRQAILQEAMRTARNGNITGKGLVAMIRYVNKYWEDRQEAIRNFRDKYDKFVSSKSVDIVQRQQYEKEFGAMFTTKKLTGANKKEIEAVDKGLAGQPMDQSEMDLFQKYLMDDDHYQKVNGMRGKKSIYDMDIEQIKRAMEEMETAKILAHDQLAYREKLKGDYTDKLAEKAREMGKKMESFEEKSNIGNYGLKARIASKRKKAVAKISDIINRFITSKHIIDEKLGAKFLKRDLDTATKEYRRKWVAMHKEEMEIAKRNKLNDKNFQRIVQHAYAREGDGNGARLLAFQLEKDKLDFVTLENVPESGIAGKIAEYAREDFLTQGEREWYEFSRRMYDITGTDVQRTNIETYNMMMGSVENYTPHFIDYAQSPIEGYTEEAMDQVLGITVEGMLKNSAEKGFTITRRGMDAYPMMDAKKIFYRHMNDAMWYAEIQGPLKIIQEVVNKTPEVWGNSGNAFWREWIDVIAKNGKMQIVTQEGRVVEWLGERAADTVLILNAGTIAKQLLSLPDAVATSGKVPLVDMAVVLKPSEWNRIMSKSEVLPYRQMELLRTNYNENFEDVVSNITRKIREYGYAPMSYIDLWVGASVFRAVYDDSIKKGMSEMDAIHLADDMVKYAIYSPFIEDLPMFITKHKRGATSVFTRFMGPSLSHFSNIMTMGGAEAKKKFGKWGAVVVTALVTVFLSALYAWSVGKAKREVTDKKAIGGEGLAFFREIVGQFGPLSIAISAGKFGDISFMGFGNLVDNLYQSIASEDDKQAKAMFGLGLAIMTIIGVPGINSVAPFLKPKKEKASTPAIRGRFGPIRSSGTSIPKSGPIQ